MFRSPLHVLTMVACLAGVMSAQAGNAWETDADQAFEKAKEQKKAVLICIHKQREIACTRMTGKLYPDPEVQLKMAAFVLIPACPDAHPTIKIKVGDQEIVTCSAFPGVTCEQHVANEKKIHERYFDSPTVKVPQHIVVDSEGRVLLSKIYEMKKTAYIGFLDRGLGLSKGIGTTAVDAQTKTYLGLVKSGTQQECENSVKAILDFNDESKTAMLFDVIEETREEKARAVAIRAMGHDQYTHAGVILRHWLEDDSDYIKNCAVVSLEEVEADGVSKSLLDLFAATKDSELKKDVVRALGPCGERKDDVKTFLLTLVAHSDEQVRMASYLSLGFYLEDKDVRDTLAQRYKKEGKDVTMKTAILVAFRRAGDAERVADVEAMVAGDRSDAIRTLADAVIVTIKGGEDVGGKQMRQLLKPVYARDKIVRNRVKEWASFGGGRRG